MIKKLLIALVKWYQKRISPITPPSCRYRPSCSYYMIVAIEKHGLKGVIMGVARILRCHPFVEGGMIQCLIILRFDAIKIIVKRKRKAKLSSFCVLIFRPCFWNEEEQHWVNFQASCNHGK